ncbi:MAG TPA: M20/M25/M40 family metallo-hydrolase [bacterium]
MKHINLLVTILFCTTALSFADQHKYLVRVDDLADHNYPIVEIIENHYLMLAGDKEVERLDADLVPYRILDADAGSGACYLVYLSGESAETVGQFGTILDRYEDCVLLKTTAENVPELNRLKVELNRLSTRPINVFSPIVPQEADLSRAPDTLIQKMVTAVSQDSIQASILRMQRMYTRYATTDSNRIILVNWIRSRLIAYGYDSVYFENFDANYGPNVIAIKRGEVYTNWNRYCVIDGHIDDVPSSGYAPGADDNASGTTAMLEAARVVKNYNFENTIRFIGFNAEEQGLIGSDSNATRAYVQGDTILGVFNFDMIGYVTSANRDTMNAHYSTAVPGCSLFVCQWFQAVADTYTQLKIRRVRNTGTSGGSDHVSFWQNGYKALCGIERVLTPMYHTIGDTIGPYMYGNCGVNNLPFATKVIQTGVAALAKLAVPIHSGTGSEELNAGAGLNPSLEIIPNPFNSNLTVRFQIQNSPPPFPSPLEGEDKGGGDYSNMSLRIFDASGKLVKSFNQLPITQLHSYSITWSGTDQSGNPLPAGVYFVKLETPETTRIEKAVLLR